MLVYDNHTECDFCGDKVPDSLIVMSGAFAMVQSITCLACAMLENDYFEDDGEDDDQPYPED